MHIMAIERLTCPRCGPAFGLILLADSVVDRRVQSGSLGCANCRERWRVEDGVGLLRHGRAPWEHESDVPAPAPVPASTSGDAAHAGLRWAALMGVREGPGVVLLAGEVAVHAGAVAAHLETVEVVAVGAVGEGAPGVSRLEAGARLPVGSAKLAGAVLGGPAADGWLEEGARAVRPAGRLVLAPVPSQAEARLEAVGYRVLARDESALVALRT